MSLYSNPLVEGLIISRLSFNLSEDEVDKCISSINKVLNDFRCRSLLSDDDSDHLVRSIEYLTVLRSNLFSEIDKINSRLSQIQSECDHEWINAAPGQLLPDYRCSKCGISKIDYEHNKSKSE